VLAPRILDLLWNKANIGHLQASHGVSVGEVEDVLFGVDDEEPDFYIVRDAANYVVYSETGDGRLLVIALAPI
jgi:hypothetical protein